MKMTSFIMITPIADVIVFGEQFFSLWVPSQDAKLLQVLSVLMIFGYMFTSGTQILYNVFGTVNKVKQNSIAVLFSGVMSIVIMVLLLKFTDLGIYVVGGVSSCVNLVRNMVFTLPASAVYLGFCWKRFYPQVLQTAIASVVLVVLGFVIKPYLPAGSWISIMISISTFSVSAFFISLFILLNKSERLMLKQKILVKL